MSSDEHWVVALFFERMGDEREGRRVIVEKVFSDAESADAYGEQLVADTDGAENFGTSRMVEPALIPALFANQGL